MTILVQKTRGLFSSKTEESQYLRFIVLAAGWWVAASLAWAGTPTWIWVGGTALLTAGHAFSWRFRNWKSPMRSGITTFSIIAAMALVPRTVMLALDGDLFPVAYFLVLFQAIISFELRTRGGLYACLGLSGMILFFVSQRALDFTFGIFLTGFTTLFLSFLAMSFLVDQVEHAQVRWFRNRFAFAWFWSLVFIVLLAVSSGVFLLLPKQFLNPINDTQNSVLPIRASDDIELPDVGRELGAVAAALPVTPSRESPAAKRTGEASTPSDPSQDAEGSPDQTEGSQVDDAGSAVAASQEESGLSDRELSAPGDGTNRATEEQALNVEEDARDNLVMQVRSPVLTYWRGQVYDTFDGERWRPDPMSWFLRSNRDGQGVYNAPVPSGVHRTRLYPQTYFIKGSAPRDTIFSGYASLVASVPITNNDTPNLVDGTVYRTVSSFPDFSIEALEEADPSSRLEYRYHQLHSSVENISLLARQITLDAFDDLERTRRIITYLDRNYEYDITAKEQLELTASPLEFLAHQSHGTSMDFATSTVLLARAAGMPARLVTGYLPGRFDPLSGTYVVRPEDEHAWAEIFFGGAGWVPIDSAPRPATVALNQGENYGPSSVNSLFSTSYSDELLGSVQSSPELFNKLTEIRFDGGVVFNIGRVLGLLMLAFTIYRIWRMLSIPKRRRNQSSYDHLTGEGRSEMLRIYFRAEKLLRKAGFGARTSTHTIAEFTAQAESRMDDTNSDLAWLRNAAWAAAYDPEPYKSSLIAEAKVRLQRLKDALKTQRIQLQTP